MFPENYAVLVVGDPDAGMFEFCCYLCSNYLKVGDKVLFVEASTSPEHIHRQLRSFSVNAYDSEVDGKMLLIDCYTPPEAHSTDASALRPEDPSNLADIFDAVTEGIEKMGGGPVRILFDSLTPLYENHDTKSVNRFFRDLSTMARFSGTMTTLVHKGILDEDQIADLVSISDGLIEMKIDENYRRFVRINHLRGVLVTPKWVPFEFELEDEEDESFVLGWNKEELG